MMATIRKQYELEGLCCGNCAAKIEKEVGGLNGVLGANVDFASKLLTVELAEQAIPENIADQARKISKRHDSDIELKEKELPQAGKRVMYLLGLDCADCAKRIETAVSRMDGIQSASIDFATQKLTIEVSDKGSLAVLARQAAQMIKEMEPDVEISYTGKAAEETPDAIKKHRLRQIGLITGAVLFVIGMVSPFSQPVEFVLFLISYLLVGGEVVLRAVKNIAKGQVFDENFLMSVATVGAFAIGDFAEGVAVMLFYQVGEFFQNRAVNRSRKSISALMDIRPDYANLKIGGEVKKVSPEEVGIGDLILIRPGERVPLDGRVIEGTSSVDTAALTGESLPRDAEPGTELLSGSVNKNGLLTVEVTREFGESTVTKILDLVQNASSQKAPTENFITKFARYYTPVVVFAALALAVIPPLVIPGASFTQWINRALTFLVVSCPCALVISIPLSFFGGIGGASKKGILVKGSNYLEALNNVDTVVFDKTGTLTKGSFKVTQINASKGWTQDEILSYAAHAELYSSHPIAASIREAYGREPDAAQVADYEEISGKGVRVKVNGKTVLAGNGKLMEAEKIEWQAPSKTGTVVYLAVDGAFAGSVVISDEIKPDSKLAIQSLKAIGVRNTVMLTGDSRAAGEGVAKELGLDAVYTELLPQQKVEQMEALSNQVAKGGKLVFIGDGINDAPVLARADVGVAMGGLGSDAAIEAADVVLMTDEPSKLVAAIRIAKKTRSIVWQNILFALGVKIVILVLAAFGIATMWAAVFGDVGVTIIAVLNAIRATRTK
ncbi:heavy metal translocating P-type ATPase [Caproiciproducens sp.]|uniref:heavy metal translocating P-type ATPase n=1 Tax=Caproiciproducens sp. TaxID=1954376 RepID=UPI002897EA5A|nr:heavy metal translocating P-type ATPase [Caproiciproducens sp.]